MTSRTLRIFSSPQSSEPEMVLNCDVVDRNETIKALTEADISIIGQLSNSSNGALLGEVSAGGDSCTVVVKPSMHETPLHDFEWGTLSKREVAAYELSQLLGWNIIPPTVLRDVNDIEASVQLFVPHDPREHYFITAPKRHSDMEAFAVFDYIANNADRKAGHIIAEKSASFDLYLEVDEDASVEVDMGAPLYGIDHGLTFHTDDKLRTVVWEYSEQPITSALLDDVNRALSSFPAMLEKYLSPFEVEKTVTRAERLLINPFHVAFNPNEKAIPWPLV